MALFGLELPVTSPASALGTPTTPRHPPEHLLRRLDHLPFLIFFEVSLLQYREGVGGHHVNSQLYHLASSARKIRDDLMHENLLVAAWFLMALAPFAPSEKALVIARVEAGASPQAA